MSPILVIGATGNVGGAVVAELIASNAPLRAMSRNAQSARLPASVEVVQGDLTEPDSLDAALDGVQTLFLVWVAPATAVRPALDRIVQRVRRIVVLSGPHQTPHPLFQQPNPIAKIHSEIERVIQASSVDWTFLRPGMFASNCRRWWAPQIRAGDVVRWPYAEVPTAPIHDCDIAGVAARALLDERHAGKDYMITGPESLTHADQVRVIGDVIQRSLRYEEISPDEARRELLTPIPAPTIIEMLLNAWGAALGHPAYLTNSVAAITGSPARTFRQWVTDHSHEFQRSA